MKQLGLNLNRGRWGGRRSGSGRLRMHSKGVEHRCREKVSRYWPLHINMRYQTQIKQKAFLPILKRAILNSRAKGLRVIHYSVQSNHLHFIVEADNNLVLYSGMRSLTVTLVRGIDKGKIQLERYHLHVLKTKAEVRNAVHYVCFNEEKHIGKRNIDPYSSVCLMLNTKFNYCVTTLDRGKSFLMNQISGIRRSEPV